VKYAEPISRLIETLSRLPGIGKKTASRLALFILNSKSEYIDEFVENLTHVKEDVTLCKDCMAFSDHEYCPVCSDDERDKAIICVVGDYKDMIALDGTGSYKGVFHVLHGSLAPLKGIGPEEIRLKELVMRVERGGIKEVVLATSFDAEGDATAHYIIKILKGIIEAKGLSMEITRLASGVPVGSFIEYMDGATLGRALDGRRKY